MAHRLNKQQSTAIGVLVIVAILIGLGIKLVESIGLVVVIILAALGISGYYIYKSYSARNHREYLYSKYQDSEIVDRIMSKTIWKGQTAEQLQDTLGAPAAVDEKLLKTKKKEVWKYGRMGANRYSTRITLDNDIVTGWDVKS